MNTNRIAKWLSLITLAWMAFAIGYVKSHQWLTEPVTAPEGYICPQTISKYWVAYFAEGTNLKARKLVVSTMITQHPSLGEPEDPIRSYSVGDWPNFAGYELIRIEQCKTSRHAFKDAKEAYLHQLLYKTQKPVLYNF